MPVGDYLKWNKRASLMYAMGAWTICGSLAYYKFTHKDEPLVTAQPIEEEDKPNIHKFESTHGRTTVVYREGFVPYSERLLNLFRGTTENSPAVTEGLKDEK